MVDLRDRFLERPQNFQIVDFEKMLEEIVLFDHILVGDVHFHDICLKNASRIIKYVQERSRRDILLEFFKEGDIYTNSSNLLSLGERDINLNLSDLCNLREEDRRDYLRSLFYDYQDFYPLVDALLDCWFLFGDFNVRGIRSDNKDIVDKMNGACKSLVYVGNGHIEKLFYPIYGSVVKVDQEGRGSIVYRHNFQPAGFVIVNSR